MEDTGVEPDRGDRLVQLFGQAQSRRRMLRVLGGLVGATLGLRAVSEHARAAKYVWVNQCSVCQSDELPLPDQVLSTRKERLKKRR